MKTAEKPKSIRLTADRNIIKADGQDLSYVTIGIVDQNGNLNPKADDLVNFEIKGPGRIVSVGNANPVSLESYQQPQRKAWRGKCLIIIQSDRQMGNIALTAKSANLKLATVNIRVE